MVGFKDEKPLSKNELRSAFSEDIRKYRNEKCYTQTYVASKLGIGQSAYQKIESGEVKISLERLMQIADILDKPIGAFTNNVEELRNSKTEQVITDEKVVISVRELNLMNNLILQQEKRITELEEKIKIREQEIAQFRLEKFEENSSK